MKKWLALMLAGAMCLSMAACGASKTEDKQDTKEPADTTASAESSDAAANTEGSDLDYVRGNGKLVVGITDFEPMDYKDADGNWIGFDADMAKAFADSLGVDVEFVEIDWDNKVLELDEIGRASCRERV